jgi:hypothetical protein
LFPGRKLQVAEARHAVIKKAPATPNISYAVAQVINT